MISFCENNEFDVALELLLANHEDFGLQQRFSKLILMTNFYIPTLKEAREESNFTPLRLHEGSKTFFLAFSSQLKAYDWIEQGNLLDDVETVLIEGRQLIMSLHQSVYLLINPNTSTYFEVRPEYLGYLKTIIEQAEHAEK